MKLLIVVDAQNDFIDGALGSKEAQVAVPKIVERINKSMNEIVLFTKDTHDIYYSDTREGKKLPVAHCIENTDGWCINKAIRGAWKDNPNTILLNANQNYGLHINNTIYKPTFGSVALMNFIKELHNSITYDLKENTHISTKIDTIEFCGFCTDICVISNVLMIKALLPEVDIIVNSELCAGVTPEKHEAALEVMRSCQIEVI